MIMDKGKFIMSLDFELFWGVRDKKTIESYGDNILGVYSATAKMLEMFEKYEVGATFATVGLLFTNNKERLVDFIPETKPEYSNENLSPYSYLETLNDVKLNKYHFALDLISKISTSTLNEIASHTFSHYYCLESGQTSNQFESDIRAAIEIAKNHGYTLESLVFPRNQFNSEYIKICEKHGITSYRGNEQSWFYSASDGGGDTKMKRAFRLFDTYINISGHNTYKLETVRKNFPYNLPSSRFLRPYSKKLKFLEKLRLNRIKISMTEASKKGKVFHLWWHPHNFGINQEENLFMLENILKHYSFLKRKYGFENITMDRLSKLLRNE